MARVCVCVCGCGCIIRPNDIVYPAHEPSDRLGRRDNIHLSFVFIIQIRAALFEGEIYAALSQDVIFQGSTGRKKNRNRFESSRGGRNGRIEHGETLLCGRILKINADRETVAGDK